MAKEKDLDLGKIISDKLNTKFKKTGEGEVAFNLDNQSKFSGVEIRDYISTGIDMLDLAVSNKKNGGLPVGRIVDISGLEGSGKSLILSHIIGNAQKKGGIGILIDTETAFSKEYFENVADVNMKDLIYTKLSTIEDCFSATSLAIKTYSDTGKDVPIVIGLDSIKGAYSKEEDTENFERKGYNTPKAVVIGDALSKLNAKFGKNKVLFVATNQLRINPQAGIFEDKYDTPGGKAFDFYSSVRIRLQLLGKLKAKDQYGNDHIVGKKVRAKVYKNRLGPPDKVIDFELHFNSGIQNFKCTFEYAINYGVIQKKGAWKKLTYKDKEYAVYNSSELMNKLYENEVNVNEFYKWLLDQVSERYIMKYEPRDEDVFLEPINEDKT